MSLRANIRPGEGTFVGVAAATLAVIVAAHMMLETARDALFLASIPAARLPLVYFGIAVMALVVMEVQKHRPRRRGRCHVLTATLFLSALATGSLWFALPRVGTAGLYALYIWSGVLTTLVLIHFWTLVADRFSITQAKRLYSIIGAGSVIGAIVGSGAARMMVEWLPARHLVIGAASLLAIAAVGLAPRLRTDCTDESPRPRKMPSLLDNIALILRRPYERKVGVLALVAAGVLTVADYVFKAVVAARMEPGELANFFATFYFALNVGSVLVQLVLVGWMVRTWSISAVLAFLPALLFLGAGGLAITGLAIMAVAIKSSDGLLRHTVQRTASELLFVPMSENVRERVKSTVDVLAQRGGQAIASLGILGAVAVGAGLNEMVWALVVLAALWGVLAISIRGPYLDVFRSTLRDEGAATTYSFPELDVASLETLVTGLSSPDDQHVLACLELLNEDGKDRLIPPLLLYHPSPEVTTRALEIFFEHRRVDVVPTIDRILLDAPPRIRPVLVRGRAALAPEPAFLQRSLHDEAPGVRVTALVLLAQSGNVAMERALAVCRQALVSDDIDERRALAESLELVPLGAPWTELRVALAADPDLDVLGRVADSVLVRPEPELASALVSRLGERSVRERLIRALERLGDDALDALESAAEDPQMPDLVRWQLPAALARCGGQRAADLLVKGAVEDDDGVIRYRCIRRLEALVSEDRSIRLSHQAIGRAVEKTLASAYRFMAWQASLEKGLGAEAEEATEVHDTIVELLGDKQRDASELVVRLIGLIERHENFSDIAYGLSRGDERAQASAVELLGSVLKADLRDAVLGLFDDTDIETRLAAGSRLYSGGVVSYRQALAALIRSGSDTLRSLGIYRVAELGAVEMTSQIREARELAGRGAARTIDQILPALSGGRTR